MRVTLLGTGSADGWPNPFCRCTSCDTERRAGICRRPSSALVDDAILIDVGPTAPHLPAGLHLAGVEHILITHGHPDHLSPAFLLTREWTNPSRVLHVWGPPSAIDLCRDWCGPDSRVEFHSVVPGERLSLDTPQGPASAQVLPARHGHGNKDVLADEAVLYLLTSSDSSTLLYATDTGLFDPEATGLPTTPADVVLLDATFGDTHDHGTGHLDLSTLPAQVDALRAHGTVDEHTRLVATHLSHHNPPSADLRARLGVIGMTLHEDFDVIDTEERHPRRTLILGGARSGKSTYAESLMAAHSSVAYIATGGERPDDDEWAERIATHRARRPSTWTTVETIEVTTELAEASDPVLVDCLALWLTGQLDRRDAWRRIESNEREAVIAELDEEIARLAACVRGSAVPVTLVSNEVGMGIVPETSSGRLFRDLLGRTNMQVAEACDDVQLMVAGRAIDLSRVAAVRPGGAP